MVPDILAEHFDLLADAPNGVQKLRVLIVELAVRSRLTRSSILDICADTGEGEYAIPKDWRWRRLEEVVAILDNQRVPVNKSERQQRISGKAEQTLFPYYGATQQVGFIDDYLFDEELVLLGEDGVPFLDHHRPKAYVISGKSWVNNHAHVLRGTGVLNRFLCQCLNVANYAGRVTGTTRLKLNQSRMKSIPIPVPPLAEQHRIVAKVDELMSLCDELEQWQQARSRTRERLCRASHAALTTATTPKQSTRHWHRIAKNFDLLYDTPQTVQQLRQTILQLAVQGKLVPQDPNDEPVQHLINRARYAKAEILRQWEMRSDKPLPEISADECELDLPEGWAWERIGDFAGVKGGKRLPKGVAFSPTRTPYVYIRVTDMKDQTVVTSDLKYINEDTHELLKRYIIQDTDLYVVIVGATIGKVGDVPSELNRMHLTENAAKLMFGEIDKQYLLLALRSELIQSQFVQKTNQQAQPKLALMRIASTVIPLPPLAEQKRIVAKVDQLMSLCDDLESKLTQCQSDGEKLMESVVHHLLNGTAASIGHSKVQA